MTCTHQTHTLIPTGNRRGIRIAGGKHNRRLSKCSDAIGPRELVKMMCCMYCIFLRFTCTECRSSERNVALKRRGLPMIRRIVDQ